MLRKVSLFHALTSSLFFVSLPFLACAPYTYRTFPSHAERIQEAIRENAQKLAKSGAILKGHSYEVR